MSIKLHNLIRFKSRTRSWLARVRTAIFTLEEYFVSCSIATEKTKREAVGS